MHKRNNNTLEIRKTLGFRDGNRGTHSSRTMMLADLQILLDANQSGASKNDYKNSILKNNILGKRTDSNRKLSAKRLCELYGLDLNIPLFRALRSFWDIDKDGQPLLAFLCALARDPLLRVATPVLMNIVQGKVLMATDIAKLIVNTFPGRFAKTTLNSISQNIRSTWTQSGHLKGRVKKIRTKSVVTPATVAFALFLGYLEGCRAQRLLDTKCIKLLELPPDRLDNMIKVASQRGILDYRNAGSIMEIRFPNLLSTEEEEMIREQN
ncbi:MAG: hypothetical protein U9N19_07395 [Thermodesulfobacteriota bacterium]|nr:hypothetical protein [Thermodesulfobacteriota bacterium]